MPRLFIAALAWGVVVCAPLAMAESQDIKGLLKAAGADGEPTRLRAIDALGERSNPAPEVVKTLSEQLQDPSAMVRAHAAHSLGRLGPAARPAIEAPTPLIVDPDAKVRRAATHAWIDIRPGPKVTIPLLAKVLKDSDPAVRTGALEIVAEMGKPAVPALVEALKQENATYWACLALGEIGPNAAEAAPALADTLKTDARTEVRREAALALAAIGSGAVAVVPVLPEALGDKEPAVAAGAAFALGQIGPGAKPAEAALTKAENSSDPFLQVVGVWAMAKIEPKDDVRRQKAVAVLAAALDSKEPRLRHAALHGLVDLNPTSEMIFPAIKRALDAGDAESREYALEALAALGGPAVPSLVDALRHEQIRPVVASILGQIGPAAKQATPVLAKVVLEDKNLRSRREALLALGEIGPDAAAAVPAAIEALQDPQATISYSACYALGKIGPAAIAAKPELTKKLKDGDQTVALAAAWALAKIDPQYAETVSKSVPLLIAGLSASEPRIRLEAAIALRCLGPAAKEAIPALKEALQDKNELVRDMVAQTLKSIGG